MSHPEGGRVLQRWAGMAAAWRYLAGQQQRSASGYSATFAGIGSCPVQSFSFEPDQGTTGGGAGPGKANHRRLTLTKPMDKLSPHLMLAASEGRHIAEVELIVTRSNERHVIRLKDVLVEAVSAAGGLHEHEHEQIVLNFATLEQSKERVE